MAKLKCTGRNCPQQAGTTDPAKCHDPEKCRFATFPKTNGDRIRALPNEELDQILTRCCISYTICSGCKGCVLEKFCDVYRSSGDWLDWLRSPVEESHE